MSDKLISKKGRPRGEPKVGFYRRVTPGEALALEKYLDEVLRGSLGQAAPGDKVAEVLNRPLPVPVEAFKLPSTLKPRPPLVLPKEVAEQVRPNYFKK